MSATLRWAALLDKRCPDHSRPWTRGRMRPDRPPRRRARAGLRVDVAARASRCKNRGGGGAPRAGVAGGAGAPPRGWGLHGASRRRNDSAFNDMYVLSAHGRGRPNARPGPLLGSVPAMWARSPFFKAFLRYLHNSTLKNVRPAHASRYCAPRRCG